jgi:hypothetical protein
MALLLSTAGVLCCVTGAIGAWIFYPQAFHRVENIADQLDVGLERVSVANQNAQRVTDKARIEVANVERESENPASDGETSRSTPRALRMLIQQQVGPNLNDLSGRLATLSDAAVAVSSLLQSFQELPASQTGRIKSEQLERLGDEAQQLSGKFRRLNALVGNEEKATRTNEVAAATSEVGLILQKCQARMEAWQTDLEAAREDVRHVKAKILGWLTPVTIVWTLLCLWMAAGQISLFAHALGWFRYA